MRHSKFYRVLLLILIVCTALDLTALELGGDFRMGNLALSQIVNSTVPSFNGNDYNSWGLSFWLKDNISDNLTIDAAFYSDPILRNICYTLFTYTESFLSLGVGPFFGLFNADLNTILKSGISTSIKLELPSILFVDFRTDSSLASRLLIVGDYVQERTDLTFGFYVKNAICSVNMLSKKFTQKEATDELIDSLNEYSFKTHLYQKNTPYKITLKFAYQNLSRQFIEAASTEQYILNSIIVGTKLEINFTNAIRFYVDMDNSVYTFGQEKLLNTIIDSYAFRGYAGMVFNIDKLLPPPIDDTTLARF